MVTQARNNQLPQLLTVIQLLQSENQEVQPEGRTSLDHTLTMEIMGILSSLLIFLLFRVCISRSITWGFLNVFSTNTYWISNKIFVGNTLPTDYHRLLETSKKKEKQYLLEAFQNTLLWSSILFCSFFLEMDLRVKRESWWLFVYMDLNSFCLQQDM